jgi:uncharacterized membrane protein
MIRIFLIIAIVFLIIRWISKLFSPGFSNNHQGTNFKNHHKEGETTIHSNKKVKKNSPKDKGEYVDFEEIE